jgi:hypothetical protein
VLVAVQTAFSAIGGFVAQTFAAIIAGALAVVTAIAQFFVGLGSGIAAAFVAMVALIGTAWQTIKAAASSVASAITTAFSTAVAAIVGFFVGLPGAVTAAFQAMLQLATVAWSEIVAKAAEITAGIVATFNSAINTVTGFFTSLRDSVLGIFDSIIAAAVRVGEAIKGAMNGGEPGAAGGGEVRAAGGGYIRGPGSSVSDSIRAWLSNGEFVIRAKAVKHYGPGFFHALNQLKLAVPRMNMGGLVDGLTNLMPPPLRMADGGGPIAVGGGGQPLTFVIDGQRFSGLTGTPDAVRELTKWATKSSTTSAGRKPAWFG